MLKGKAAFMHVADQGKQLFMWFSKGDDGLVLLSVITTQCTGWFITDDIGSGAPYAYLKGGFKSPRLCLSVCVSFRRLRSGAH